MILSNHNKANKKNNRGWLLIAGLSICLLLLLWSKSTLPKQKATFNEPPTIFCDAESIHDGNFSNNGINFGSAITQSDNHPHSGKYAARLTAKNRFGLIYTTTTFKKGWQYKASVWRYTESSKGYLTVEGNTGSKFKIIERIAIEEKDGFEKVQIIFSIPDIEGLDTLKIYAGVDQQTGTVYFDDLSIEILETQAQIVDFSPDLIKIGVDDKAYNQFTAQKWEAVKVGLLFSGDDNRVKGELFSKNENKKIPIKLRLKGDWTDHLSGSKWSFRIKTMKESAWNRLCTFSIQNPKTRGYLNEWIFHQFLQKEDILSPRYDFIDVEFNNKYLGVYAFEEHFDKQLPEGQSRREGPILKLTEDLFWQGMRRQFVLGDKNVALYKNAENAFEGSDIRPFKEGKIQSSPTLSAQFQTAQKLLHQFKYNLKPASEIFDLNRMAKYFAIMDILGAYHGRFWHNLRFYYNPISSKLEPIGFDGFGETDTPLNGQIVMGYKVDLTEKGEDLTKLLFQDPMYFRLYMKHLHRMSTQAYMQNFFALLQPNIEVRLKFLQKEFPKYSFSKEALLKRAKNIHLLIEPLGEQSVIVRTQKKVEHDNLLKVSNTHPFPIEVIGYGQKQGEMEQELLLPIFIFSNIPHKVPMYTDVKIPILAQFIFYRVAGLDQVFSAKIVDWPISEGATTRQEIFSRPLVSNDIFEVNGHKILFRKGKHITTKDISIPTGHEVYFEAGCSLDLQQKAAFISLSPVFMNGTEESPISIYSSDKTGNGFTVLQANKTSTLSYCRFDHLNTLNKGNWTLTGGVTFFESDVNISHSAFTNNHCEDGLNIVHADFNLFQSVISNTFSDGLDADFCTGIIDQTIFRQTGNDAMDFSGSVITIKKADIYDAGDKGVSVGEKAEVYVQKLQIIGANTGVASKDLSILTIDYIHLEDCIKGFAAYQKKPEYGNAKIIVKGYMAKDVKHLHVLYKGSILDLDGTKYTGDKNLK